jgi:hypothetical protein
MAGSEDSQVLLAYFVLVVLTTAALVAEMAAYAFPRHRGIVWMVLAAWLIATAGIAATRVLAKFERMPPPLVILIGVSFLATTVFCLSSAGKRLTEAVPVAWLIGFQAFRIFVEIFLDWGYHDGLVPRQLTLEGRNFDLLTGLAAIPVAWLASRGTIGRGAVLAWNVIGLGLLANVVGTAMFSVPTRFRLVSLGPANTFVAGAPYIWLPVLLVQAAWFGHLLVFRKSSRGYE